MNSVVTTQRPQVGWHFGPYQVEGILGEGGVATVYSVRDAQGQQLAMKVLKHEAAQLATVRCCFNREYTLAARLSHQGIVRALENGEINGHTYLTMPTITGGTLAARLTAGRRLPIANALLIAQQVATALDHIHRCGIVHRDVKPANILLDGVKGAQLCDFGLAIDLTAPQAVAAGELDDHLYGTPLYIAPEQARAGTQVDGRADLYALGVVLYRMVTGRAPFYGLKADLLQAHMTATPPAPAQFARITPALNTLILKAIAKAPAARFQNGAEFAAALANPALAIPQEKHYHFPRWFQWLGQRQAS